MGGRGSSSGKSGGRGIPDKAARDLNALKTNRDKEKVLRGYDEGTEVTLQQGSNQAVYTKIYDNYWEAPTGERVSTRTLVSIATLNTDKVRSRFMKVVKS